MNFFFFLTYIESSIPAPYSKEFFMVFMVLWYFMVFMVLWYFMVFMVSWYFMVWANKNWFFQNSRVVLPLNIVDFFLIFIILRGTQILMESNFLIACSVCVKNHEVCSIAAIHFILAEWRKLRSRRRFWSGGYPVSLAMAMGPLTWQSRGEPIFIEQSLFDIKTEEGQNFEQ